MWTSVELRQIRTFLTLAEELHYGRTATRLGVTSSNVTQTIQGLEALVGGRLFERTSRRVHLTPLGEQLRHEMGPAYGALESAFRAGRETAIGVAGVLRLGTYSRGAAGDRLFEIIGSFHERHPDCRVELVDTGFERDQFGWLRSGDVDALVLRLPVSERDVGVGPVLSSESRVVLVARDHPLADRQSVVYDELADFTLTTGSLPPEMMAAFVPPITPAGRAITTVRIPSLEEAVMRVATGEVVHATVATFLDYYPFPNVVAVPIADLAPSETALTWLRANTSMKLHAFVAAAADVVGALL